ncbi:MAG TPA: radical SAM protein [Balneolaceae bacterium]|nr:radical SAM protein [Balneolaceae bacterium]|tara:strand:+ start:132431 stop:133486 length:1056 start_codon:yes stop_codon:yes gene_type:complete
MALENPIKGRGSSDNPVNRFEGHYTDYDLDEISGEKPSQKTHLLNDDTKTILSHNTSPDIPFNVGLNPYRGCEHGCAYCYARPYHEYLGFSPGLDFETKIMVKRDAATLLKKELRDPKWEPQVIAMSGVTDIYQPIERDLEITRACLKVLAEFRNPVGLITKNHLITRDIDILSEMAQFDIVHTTLSITTLDKELGRLMEPRTSSPYRRLKAIEKLAEAGIPVGVNVAPVIPGLTDFETSDILRSAADAGAAYANYILLRLPYKVKDLFMNWLEQHYPERKQKVSNRLKDMREGKLYDSNWGDRMSGKGNYSDQIKKQFDIQIQRYGLEKVRPPLPTHHFVKSQGTQLPLF